MNQTEATADVFLTALKALPVAERKQVLVRIMEDRSMRKDLLDLSVFEERKNESSRPFRDYLASRQES